MDEEVKKNNIWFGKHGTGVSRIKKFLDENSAGLVPETLWLAKEVGTNDAAKKEIVKLSLSGEVFETPKPESLISRVLHIATNPGDLILDSFVGSGTTAAVAHKLGRRYIGIEMGEHAVSHCVPRLNKVIDGEQGGISGSVGWQGGGGFRFYRLGPSVFDETGQIQPEIAFPVLAAHIWFSETATPIAPPDGRSPFLGVHRGTGYALLYNGILGDKRPNGGNVMTRKTLQVIRDACGGFDGPLVIYGERTALGAASLEREGITFKQTPYDVKARR